MKPKDPVLSERSQKLSYSEFARRTREELNQEEIIYYLKNASFRNSIGIVFRAL